MTALLCRQRFERTDHLAQQVGGDLDIACGGVQLAMAQQHLDHADVHLLLQQMGGETVATMPTSA